MSTDDIGLDFALLWGVMAFALNFVPNIGSILAAVPAILLAVLQFGPKNAVVVMTLFGVVNIIMGNVVEPKIMGERLGLSTLTVFLSLVFWGWLLGPVGMLLSVPLTMVVKFAAMNNPMCQNGLGYPLVRFRKKMRGRSSINSISAQASFNVTLGAEIGANNIDPTLIIPELNYSVKKLEEITLAGGVLVNRDTVGRGCCTSTSVTSSCVAGHKKSFTSK